MKESLAILIPAYNAEMTLPDLLSSVNRATEGHTVIVIDDGSTDRTAEIAAGRGARVVRHDRNRGKGAALNTGFQVVVSEQLAGAVVTLDADLQHDAADLQKFIDARRLLGANIVIGERAGRLKSGMPAMRIVSNALTSFLVTARTGISIPDSQCGYRLIGREVLEAVNVTAEGYEAETEFLIRAARHGFRIVCVPVRTVYRGEQSSMTHWKTTKRFVQTLFREY